MGCIIPGILIFFGLYLFTIDVWLGTFATIAFFSLAFYFVFKSEGSIRELNNTKMKKLSDLKGKLEGFIESKEFVAYDLETALILDEENSKLAIIRLEDEYVKTYDYSELLESEVIEDGITVNKTSRSSQIGGALLGGVLAGGVGAIIGGLSGSSTSTQEVNSVDIKIVVNDTSEPIFIINFAKADVPDFNGKPFPMKKDDEKYKKGIKSANYWHSLISVLIKKADDLDKKNEKDENEDFQKRLHGSVKSHSIAEELKKLKELQLEGILTSEEFESQKKKLLS
ncbi:SHOCT domain-containing protein [Alkalihalobacillus sp. 1P02AB]|uniref:SHOCT domain-containing protein n=1 Tax=Alkalihalobacillus sp. 1P02AB TaxID=3132260 RepID=UPI0039A67A06